MRWHSIVIATFAVLLTAASPAKATSERAVEVWILDGAFPFVERLIAPAAEAEDPSAMYLMGQLYQEPNFEKCDIQVSMDWYRRAASLGHGKAFYRLSQLYTSGLYVIRDPVVAFRLMRESAERGYVDAYSAVARWYFLGNGVPIDPVQAVEWARTGADLRAWKAISLLAYFHYFGIDGTRDIQAAIDLSNRYGASPGSDEGKFIIALLSRYGLGRPQDLVQAVELLKSGSINFPPAMRELASMYDAGVGVPQDWVEADALRIKAMETEETLRRAYASRSEGGLKERCRKR